MKAYTELWSSTYEPAEGGYYVAVSRVYFWQEFSTVEEFIKAVETDSDYNPETAKSYTNTTHQVESDRPCDSDGYPDYDYLPVVMEYHLPECETDVLLINGDYMPAPTIYLGYR